MKKVLIILGAVFGAFVLLLAGIFFVVFRLTADLPSTATRFFAAVRANDMVAAQAELSQQFKASTNAEALRHFVDESALGNVVDTDWSSFNITGKRGELKGVVISAEGGRIPLTMVFVDENDTWKIYSISKPSAGLSESESGEVAMPDLAQRTALVKRSMPPVPM
ncbi:hypothetical protein [Pseudomarimonas arenosa]|uniref:DUF4878 domain-containing protein n=1 Tax=Pseudomarimonas arenosa TaxID=2774145 RepID=A0AAW3ZPW2_9GAMM|nr:hypothetical protein [Pseudomarimonas arenosa]MBD8527555.1 hypothetical protein [Pseudomarimonas arenosa]